MDIAASHDCTYWVLKCPSLHQLLGNEKWFVCPRVAIK
jgi:hypothetical protein